LYSNKPLINVYWDRCTVYSLTRTIRGMDVFVADADDSLELDGEVASLCLTSLSSFSALSTRLTRVLRTPVIINAELTPPITTCSAVCTIMLFFVKSLYIEFTLKSFLPASLPHLFQAALPLNSLFEAVLQIAPFQAFLISLFQAALPLIFLFEAVLPIIPFQAVLSHIATFWAVPEIAALRKVLSQIVAFEAVSVLPLTHKSIYVH